MGPSLLTFAIAFVASLTIAVPVRRLALRLGMVDVPGPRKIHLGPIPLLGGIAIYTAVVLALLIGNRGQSLRPIAAIMAAATLLVLLGTLDDRGLLHHQIKLFLGFPAAGLIVLASGSRAQVFSVLLPGRFGAVADAILTVFWITAITASFSILDYMDGLCAGVAAIASLFIAILAILNGQVLVGTLAAAVVGAALGFLRWNFGPAKMFMGDGGAMFLGFLVAALALQLRMNPISRTAAWLVPVLILGVPILDTTLVSVSRLGRGLIPFTSPGKDHTGHRLANYGLGTRGAVLLMYAAGTGFGLLAIVCIRLGPGEIAPVSALLALALVGAIAVLEYLPFERQGTEAKLPPQSTPPESAT
jgi:UDP-GlcNAc:undecaprenyl-phosphate/decaprenyl-phosphate GlcNAc-1-phosphate transferase